MKHGNSGERADSTEKAVLHRVSGCDVTKSAGRGQSFPKSEKEKAKGRPCRKTIEQRRIARHVDRRRQTRGRPLECRKGSETERQRMEISSVVPTNHGNGTVGIVPVSSRKDTLFCRLRNSCTLREVWPLGKRSWPPTHAKFRGSQRGKSGFLGASIPFKTPDIVAFAICQTENPTPRRYIYVTTD